MNCGGEDWPVLRALDVRCWDFAAMSRGRNAEKADTDPCRNSDVILLSIGPLLIGWQTFGLTSLRDRNGFCLGSPALLRPRSSVLGLGPTARDNMAGNQFLRPAGAVETHRYAVGL